MVLKAVEVVERRATSRVVAARARAVRTIWPPPSPWAPSIWIRPKPGTTAGRARDPSLPPPLAREGWLGGQGGRDRPFVGGHEIPGDRHHPLGAREVLEMA